MPETAGPIEETVLDVSAVTVTCRSSEADGPGVSGSPLPRRD